MRPAGVNTLVTEEITGDSSDLDTRMAVMTTVKKVYILLWKNLIIKVKVLCKVYRGYALSLETALVDVHS